MCTCIVVRTTTVHQEVTRRMYVYLYCGTNGNSSSRDYTSYVPTTVHQEITRRMYVYLYCGTYDNSSSRDYICGIVVRTATVHQEITCRMFRQQFIKRLHVVCMCTCIVVRTTTVHQEITRRMYMYLYCGTYDNSSSRDYTSNVCVLVLWYVRQQFIKRLHVVCMCTCIVVRTTTVHQEITRRMYMYLYCGTYDNSSSRDYTSYVCVLVLWYVRQQFIKRLHVVCMCTCIVVRTTTVHQEITRRMYVYLYCGRYGNSSSRDYTSNVCVLVLW